MHFNNRGVIATLFFGLILFMLTLSSCSQEPINEVNPEMIFDAEAHEGKLTVHFFHLIAPDRYEKTGESIFIKTPKGTTILIDAGKPMVGPLINDYLNDLGVEKIDYVIPSHPHSDHIGGYVTLFQEKEIGKVVEINLPLEESSVYQDYRQLIEEKELEVEHVEEGDTIQLEKDLVMEILNPIKGLSPETYSFDQLSPGIVNDVSMVIKMTHQENTFLFTGDIYRGVESSLISKYGEDLDVDVVVAPHHGLGTSNSEQFIEATDPNITLIPSNVLFDLNIVDQYESQGSEVYISKFDGNVLLVSNGKKIDVFRETESDEIEADDPDEIEENEADE